jgi:ketosteroid isomerase-like protein
MSEDAIEVVRRFNEALNAGDLSGMIACLTEDTVFENTEPAPDGERYEGKAAVGAFWKAFLEGSQAARIEVEELLGCGERVVMRWRYAWRETSGASGHIRGIDVYRLRRGRIAEKLSYVKG